MDKPVLPALQKKFTISVEVPEGEREAFMGMLDAFHSGGTQYHEAVRARAADAQQGLESLQHLYQVAQGDHGACRHVARFLLGLYNGTRFPFDLTDLRCLDRELFEHCMAVLRMDYAPKQEVHSYFDKGGRRFEQMAKDWNVRDHTKDGSVNA